MRALLAILVLLTFLPCDGQVRRRVLGPKAGGSSPITLPVGIQYRWIATNLFDPVTNWTDTVSGFSWTNSANFPRFTNGLGVHFNGAQHLYTTNVVLNDSNYICVIWKPDAITGDTYCLVGNDGTGILLATENSKFYCVGSGGDWDSPVAGNIYDFQFAYNQIGHALTAGSTFTNGMLAYTGGSWTANTLARIGIRNNNTCLFKGTLYEFIVWSNSYSFGLTEVTNIHRYATNRWPHSP